MYKGSIRVFGKASEISIGADGTVFILGKDRTSEGYEIFKLDKSLNGWMRYPGWAMKMATDFEGNPWIIDKSFSVFRYKNGWQKAGSRLFKQILSGHDGSIFALDGIRTR